MKELKSYIQSVNTCSDSLIREVWSDQDECSMIFPKGEVEGLDAVCDDEGQRGTYHEQGKGNTDLPQLSAGEKAGACALFQTAVRHGVNTCEHSYIST